MHGEQHMRAFVQAVQPALIEGVHDAANGLPGKAEALYSLLYRLFLRTGKHDLTAFESEGALAAQSSFELLLLV